MLKWEFEHAKHIGCGLGRGSVVKDAVKHQIPTSFFHLFCLNWVISAGPYVRLSSWFLFHCLWISVSLSFSLPSPNPPSFPPTFPPPILPSFVLSHFSSSFFLCHIFPISVPFSFLSLFRSSFFSSSFTHNLLYYFSPENQTTLSLLASNPVPFHTDSFQPHLIAFI